MAQVARSGRSSAMGKVHGSLARAGKVKNQTPKASQDSFERWPECRGGQSREEEEAHGTCQEALCVQPALRALTPLQSILMNSDEFWQVSVVKTGPKRGPNSNAGK